MATPRNPRKSSDSKRKSGSSWDGPESRDQRSSGPRGPSRSQADNSPGRPAAAGGDRDRKPLEKDRAKDRSNSYRDRPNERKPFERKPSAARDGERKPFNRRDDERKPFERKPAQARQGSDRPFKKRDDVKPPFVRRSEEADKDRSHETPYPKDRAKPQRSVWDDPTDMESDFSGEKTWSRKIPLGADRLDEIKACGINACRAIFAKRPSDLVRAYVTEETLKEFGDMLKFCSANKKAYHVVRPDELNKISGSSHHEGVCVIAKALPPTTWHSLQESLVQTKAKPALILILEDVGNPHNVGAIIRTAAHFGVTAILATGQQTFKPSPSLLRTAEGGYEALTITTAPDLETLTLDLRKLGFQVVATASQAKKTIYQENALTARVAFIIGNESRGISATARKVADTAIAIPGTGAVESLNVSAATATLCGEFWRTYRV